jgi:hypothetical protein
LVGWLIGYWFDLLTSLMETTKVKDGSETFIFPHCRDGPQGDGTV